MKGNPVAILIKNTDSTLFVTEEDFGGQEISIVNFESIDDANRAIKILEKKDEIEAKAAMRIEKETSRLGFWDRKEYPTVTM
jgi:hypothetical protein